jgi:hypothetical protein
MIFAAIILCVASQRVFLVASVYFVKRHSPETFGYTLVCSTSGEGKLQLLMAIRMLFTAMLVRHFVSAAVVANLPSTAHLVLFVLQ